MTDADVVRRKVLVSGRVQGVFFRDSCRRVAVGAGVRGWARNLPDGRVEVVAEGSPDAVDAVVRWCGDGPPRARVDHVEVADEPPAGAHGFNIC
ncbi:MAG TPA: acylphosphatase [Acidimicrobiales bacterium]|nr:acylphosphatase [Acidimicrobiales bacterium]